MLTSRHERNASDDDEIIIFAKQITQLLQLVRDASKNRSFRVLWIVSRFLVGRDQRRRIRDPPWEMSSSPAKLIYVVRANVFARDVTTVVMTE